MTEMEMLKITKEDGDGVYFIAYPHIVAIYKDEDGYNVHTTPGETYSGKSIEPSKLQLTNPNCN